MVSSHKKNILLYLGKFPGYGFDIDGGSILARQLIDTLKVNCNLDLVFIRKNHETYEDSQINQVRYVEYKDAFNNKFVRRLKNLDTNVDAIGDHRKYDTIITAHVSKFFGFQGMPDSFWNKTILFPMFCTSSYVRAGETVPHEYTEQERYVIEHVNKIICPSLIEKLDISRDYNVNDKKIEVIPRGISPIFNASKHFAPDSHVNIICIGSIKRQKNNIDALRVLSVIMANGFLADLHLVCTIQDKCVHEEMLQYIEQNNLKENVHFHIELSQSEVAELMKGMDANISVSRWETFGRGIFEGISSGIPTFVYDRLTGVKDLCDKCEGVAFCQDADAMAKSIIETCHNKDLYIKKCSSLAEVAHKVSYDNERKLLLSAIL